jgi:anti-sigma factor RsiW
VPMSGDRPDAPASLDAMRAHPTRAELAAFLRRRLDPEQLLRVDRHLESCAECRAAVDGDPALRNARASLRRALLGVDNGLTHPSYEELAASVDGELSAAERGRLEEHLERCEACRQSRCDLEALSTRAAPAGSEWRKALAWTAAAASVIVAASLVMWTRPDAVSPGTAGPSATPLPSAPTPAAAPSSTNGLPGPDDLEALPPAFRRSLASALRTGRLDKPAALEGLLAAPGTLLGEAAGPGRFSLLTPLATVVEAERPTFRWHPLAEADGYEVRVYDADYHEVLASGVVASSSWTPPRPLRRGQVFSWVVTALKNGERIRAPEPPAPEARFRVLDPAGLAALRDLQPSASRSMVALGVLYASLGLLDEAEAHLANHLEAHPQSPKVADLLRGIRRWRGAGGLSCKCRRHGG